MKVLTLNFLTCAVKACKSTSASFPLHPKDCELVSDSIAPNQKLLTNVLPRVDWAALIVTASEVRLLVPFSLTFTPLPLTPRSKVQNSKYHEYTNTSPPTARIPTTSTHSPNIHRSRKRPQTRGRITHPPPRDADQ